MEVGILHAPLPQTPPQAALARLLGNSEPLKLVDRLPENTPEVPVVFLDSHPSTEPWPMGEEELAHFGRGLSAADKQALRASKAVTVLTFKGPGRAALATYRRSLVLIAGWPRRLVAWCGIRRRASCSRRPPGRSAAKIGAKVECRV